MKKKLIINQLRARRFYFCLLSLLLLPAAIQAEDYDLWVAGTQVTSDNASDVLSDGKVSWNNSSKTLTLNGATINGQVVCNVNSAITIHLIGTSTITTTQNQMPIYSSLSNAQDLTFTAAEGAMLLTNKSRTDGNPDICSGFNFSGESDIPRGYSLSWDAEEMCSLAEYYDIYFNTFVNNSQYFQPYYVTAANCERLMGTYNETSGQWNNSRIAVSYDYSQKTLTLDNAIFESAEPYNTTYFLNCAGDKAKTITINLVGENKFIQNNSEPGAKFATMNVYEGKFIITTDANNPGSLTSVDLYSEDSENFNFIEGDVEYRNGLEYSYAGDGIRYIKATPGSLGLKVAGTVVTTENAANVLGDDISEEGSVPTVSFDAATNTLTLNCAMIDMSNLGSECPVESSIQNLNVKLMNYNSFTLADGTDWPYIFKYTGEEKTATLTLKTEASEWGNFGSLSARSVESEENLCYGYKLTNELNPTEDEISGWEYSIEQGWQRNTLNIAYTEYYNVWIGSSRLTSSNRNGGHSGDINYTDEDHTLYLGGISYSFTVKSHLSNLTVKLGNENTITDIVFEATDEMPNGTLTLEANNESAVLDLYIENDEPFAGFDRVNYKDQLFMTYITGETSNYYHVSVKQLEEPGYHFSDSPTGSSYYSSGSTVSNLNYGQENTLPWLINVPEGLAINYRSGNEAVATIDQRGTITLTGAGYVWIYASNEATEVYKANTDSIRLEIRPSDPQASIGYGAYYVGDTVELIATVPNGEMYYKIGWDGEKVKYTEPIVLQKGIHEISLYTRCSSADGEMWSYGNNHPTYHVFDKLTFTPESGEISNDTIKVVIGHLPEENQSYPASVYYYFDDDEDRPTIYLEDEEISVAVTKKVNAYIQVKGDSGNVYKSKPVEATYTVLPKTELNISYADNTREWASYYADESLETPEGLEAYLVTAASEDGVTVSYINYIPQGEGVLLKNASKKVEEPIMAKAYMDAAPEVSDNLLNGTDKAIGVSSLDGSVYVLYNDGFTRATKGSIPAHRAYLVLNQHAGARLLIWEDEETTRLSEVERNDETSNEAIYNLNGQRISKPTKGLYISNGRKKIAK